MKKTITFNLVGSDRENIFLECSPDELQLLIISAVNNGIEQ